MGGSGLDGREWIDGREWTGWEGVDLMGGSGLDGREWIDGREWTGWEGVDWIFVAQVRSKWCSLVEKVMKIRLPENVGTFQLAEELLACLCFLLGNYPAPEICKPTFRNTLSVPSL